MVLRPAQRLAALAVGRRGCIDVFGDGRRANEADRLHPLIGEQHVHRFLVAVDDVQHAGRQPGFGQQLAEQHGRAGVLFRGLEHEGIPAGDGHRQHPQRHHGRKVERGDADADAQRLHQRVGINVATDIGGELTLEQVRDATGKLDHFQPAGDFALGVGKHLAVLAGDQAGDVVTTFFEQFLETKHDPRAHQRRRL